MRTQHQCSTNVQHTCCARHVEIRLSETNGGLRGRAGDTRPHTAAAMLTGTQLSVQGLSVRPLCKASIQGLYTWPQCRASIH